MINFKKIFAAILLIPTTLVSLILSFFFLILASVGASLLVLLGVLIVVWSANIVMWCVFFRKFGQKNPTSIKSSSNSLWYYLIISAALALVGYAFTDPWGILESTGLAWVLLTLIYFGVIVKA